MKRTRRKHRRHINLLPIVGIILGVAGLILSLGGHWQEYGRFDLQHLKRDFYANAGTELISIAITVVVIDTLYRFRERRQYKAQLIRQLGSGDRSTALQAVPELKVEDWFYDGALHGARLWHADLSLGQMHYANLEGADLRAANLRGTELKSANLRQTRLNHADLSYTEVTEADFSEANLKGVRLQGSNISLAQIQSATTLEGATMPDGSSYAAWLRRPVTYEKRRALPASSPTHAPETIRTSGQNPFLFLWLGLGAALMILIQQIGEQLRQRTGQNID